MFIAQQNIMFDACGVADFLPDYSINVLSRRDKKTNCLLDYRKTGVQLDTCFCSSIELW